VELIDPGHARALAARWLADRRRRDELFPDSWLLFAEPAWDLLLFLFVAGDGGSSVSETAACHVAPVPPVTTRRWLKALEQAGLVLRQPDEEDDRRCHVRLTDEGEAYMLTFFSGSGQDRPVPVPA
jgi:DNA-binding transcriptional ArsR family regulator